MGLLLLILCSNQLHQGKLIETTLIVQSSAEVIIMQGLKDLTNAETEETPICRFFVEELECVMYLP